MYKYFFLFTFAKLIFIRKMKTTQILLRPFNKGVIQQRTDGFFNAHSLTNMYNAETGNLKHPSNFLRNDSTKEFIAELSKHTGLSTEELFTKPRQQSCWMHPLLFLDFAMWVSPDFKLKVLLWLQDNLIEFRNQSGDYYIEMTQTISDTYQKWAGKKANALIFIKEANFLNELMGIESNTRNELNEKQLSDLNKLQLANIRLMKSGIGKIKRHEQLRLFYDLIK